MKNFKYVLIALFLFSSAAFARGSVVYQEYYKGSIGPNCFFELGLPDIFANSDPKYAVNAKTLSELKLADHYASAKDESQRDAKKATYWLEKVVQYSPRAQLNAHLMYMVQNSVIHSEEKSLFWLKEAAKNGDPVAQGLLASYYYLGINNVPRDLKTSYRLALKAAQQNDLSGVYLSEMLKRYYPLMKNIDELLMLAKNNDSEAQYQLGIIYLLGLGDHWVKINNSLALDYLNQSAQQNNAKALYALGSVYQFGSLDQKVDLQKAKFYYQKAVDAGDSFAPSQLASLIEDPTKSFELNKLGAARGDYEAMNYLALYYSKKSNIAQANEWLQKSMKARPNMYAANALATSYALGLGIKKDINKANELYKQAAKMTIIELMDSYNLPTSAVDATQKRAKIVWKLRDSKRDLGDIFGKYQIAQAQHQDLSKELSRDFPPEVVILIQTMSRAIANTCEGHAFVK